MHTDWQNTKWQKSSQRWFLKMYKNLELKIERNIALKNVPAVVGVMELIKKGTQQQIGKIDDALSL